MLYGFSPVVIPRAVRRTGDLPVTPKKHVALLIETSNAYARGLLRGIMAYIRERSVPWSLQFAEHGRGEITRDALRNRNGHGVIARIENKRVAAVVRASGCPAVDVSAARLLPALPWVETDDAAIAQAALDHLTERGLRHFGYCGDDRFNWSQLRCRHFGASLAAAGLDYQVGPSPRQGPDALMQWIRALPRPAGVLACYDIRGREVLDACQCAGVVVPDEVAVVGVDDDDLVCELSTPPLSSVAPDSRRAGWTAAELLDKLMAGIAVPPAPHLIPPLAVRTRRSTDMLAVEDADLAAALRLIRDRACDGLTVNQLVAHLPLSRRVLEARFRKVLGRSPHDQIIRVRLGRAKELLAGSSLTLDTIARRTGFRHGEYLSTVFRRECGEAPGRYRRQHYAGPSSCT